MPPLKSKQPSHERFEATLLSKTSKFKGKSLERLCAQTKSTRADVQENHMRHSANWECAKLIKAKSDVDRRFILSVYTKSTNINEICGTSLTNMF
jgi:hypothetical protein